MPKHLVENKSADYGIFTRNSAGDYCSFYRGGRGEGTHYKESPDPKEGFRQYIRCLFDMADADWRVFGLEDIVKRVPLDDIDSHYAESPDPQEGFRQYVKCMLYLCGVDAWTGLDSIFYTSSQFSLKWVFLHL